MAGSRISREKSWSGWPESVFIALRAPAEAAAWPGNYRSAAWPGNYRSAASWEGGQNKSRKIVKLKIVDLVNASISKPVAPPYHFSNGRL